MKRKESISNSTRAKKRQKIIAKPEKAPKNHIKSELHPKISIDDIKWQNFPFANFPLEIQLHIISHLDLTSQERFRTASKYWYNIINSSHEFWKARYHRDFGGPKPDLTFREAHEQAAKEVRELLKNLPKKPRKRRKYDSFESEDSIEEDKPNFKEVFTWISKTKHIGFAQHFMHLGDSEKYDKFAIILDIAVQLRHMEAIKYLSKYFGADAEMDGKEVLLIIELIEKDDVEMVKLLLGSCEDSEWCTEAIHKAKSIPMLKALINFGIRDQMFPYRQQLYNNDGTKSRVTTQHKTKLMVALENNNMEMVSLILANPVSMEDNLKKVLNIAKKNHRDDIIKMIKYHYPDLK
jgi:hypothetical protein